MLIEGCLCEVRGLADGMSCTECGSPHDIMRDRVSSLVLLSTGVGKLILLMSTSTEGRLESVVSPFRVPSTGYSSKGWKGIFLYLFDLLDF
jgi:hypothetical protein